MYDACRPALQAWLNRHHAGEVLSDDGDDVEKRRRRVGVSRRRAGLHYVVRQLPLFRERNPAHAYGCSSSRSPKCSYRRPHSVLIASWNCSRSPTTIACCLARPHATRTMLLQKKLLARTPGGE